MPFPELRCVVSVSGLRGVVGETMDPATAGAAAAVYGVVIAKRGRVVLGRDSRPTGALLSAAVSAALRGVGCDVVDIGVVPTPTVPIMIKRLRAAGGIQLSASHNPVEWNALKLFNRRGRNIDQAQLARFLAAYAEPPADLWSRWAACGREQRSDEALAVHRERVLAVADRETIAAAGLHVLVDSVNGAGSRIAPGLLEALGCSVTPLYTDPERIFPRDPEPIAANVRETGKVVKAVKAAVGFVQDPDADRLALLDERGRFIGEEYTLVLCAQARLMAARAAGQRSPVAVTNLSTSRMLDDVAAAHGGRVVRTPVGEANVVDGMQEHAAVIAGEGNGGVIDPRVVAGRDSHAGMALILELLARSGRPLSELVDEIPRYHIHKEKIALDRAGVLAARDAVLGALGEGGRRDERDGLHVAWDDRWVHLRASGTEPVSRIIAEAASAAAARDLAAVVRRATGAGRVTH